MFMDQVDEIFEGTIEAVKTACWNNVVRGRFKYLRVSVREGRIRVSCPYAVTHEELSEFIEAHAHKVWTWVTEQKSLIRKRQKNSLWRIDLKNGGRLPYLGEVLGIRYKPEVPQTMLSSDKKELWIKAQPGEREQDILREVWQWLRARFDEHVKNRGSYWIDVTSLVPQGVQISLARKRWGSCTRKGVIRLSWRLICLPTEFFDYVFVHELVHLRHFDHSPAFWHCVESFFPRAQEVRQKLKDIRSSDFGNSF